MEVQDLLLLHECQAVLSERVCHWLQDLQVMTYILGQQLHQYQILLTALSHPPQPLAGLSFIPNVTTWLAC